jgi:hypothetical protein
MDSLTLLEILTVTSLILQAVLCLVALYAYSHITGLDKQAWKWFIIGMSGIILRRALAVSRCAEVFNNIIIEYFITIGVTICIIIYIIKKCKFFDKRNGP